MIAAASRKLPKAERREQLLETAHAIVREEGTEALALGRLAERAGVSKPIAYEHFGTRSGLLMALFNAYNDRQLDAQRDALAAGGRTLGDVARILAEAYVTCANSIGPEMGAVYAALSGTEETADFRQSVRDGYLAEYRIAFGRFVVLPAHTGNAIYSALLGAAEAASQDAAAGRTTHEDAVSALTAIFTATLGCFSASGPVQTGAA